MAQVQIICDSCNRTFKYSFTEGQYGELKRTGEALHLECPYCGETNIEPVSLLSAASAGHRGGKGAGYSAKVGIGAVVYFFVSIGAMFMDLRYMPFLLFILVGIVLAIERSILVFIPVVLGLLLYLVYSMNNKTS